MSNRIASTGFKEIEIAAGDSIAVYTQGEAKVSQLVGSPNVPEKPDELQVVNNTEWVSSTFTSATTIQIYAGSFDVYYETGVSPRVKEASAGTQGDPIAVNVTGPVTAAAILSGIVTSTTAAAVAGTIPTGATMDAASNFAIDDSVDWSVIATGANAFTVTADTGHTIVGNAVVATVTSGLFRTRKTAADTFVTYRIG